MQGSKSQAKIANPSILCVGHDTALLGERFTALIEAGYRVQGMMDIGETLVHLRQKKFDAIVIGHAVPIQDRNLVVNETRRRSPGTRIVVLYQDNVRNSDAVDAVVSVAKGTNSLLRILDRLLNAQR